MWVWAKEVLQQGSHNSKWGNGTLPRGMVSNGPRYFNPTFPELWSHDFLTNFTEILYPMLLTEIYLDASTTQKKGKKNPLAWENTNYSSLTDMVMHIKGAASVFALDTFTLFKVKGIMGHFQLYWL